MPDQITMSEWRQKIEDAIHESQVRVIARDHGQAAADGANYGWGVDDGQNFVSVATKVYGRGVLESVARYPAFQVYHNFRGFDEGGQ